MGGGRFSENKETIGKEKSAIAQQRRKKQAKARFHWTRRQGWRIFCFHLYSQGEKNSGWRWFLVVFHAEEQR